MGSKANLYEVLSINGQLVISVQAFAAIFHYSERQVLRLIAKLIKQKIFIAFQYKHIWYIFIPKKPITNTGNLTYKTKENPNNLVELPNGRTINLDWEEIVEKLPEDIADKYKKFPFSLVNYDGHAYLTVMVVRSPLSPNGQTPPFPYSLIRYPAIKDYKYGHYIIYDPKKMSTFNPGADGSLKSLQLPAAFFELCRMLDAAEQQRNGSNPGLPAKRNLNTTVSFETGTIAVAATIPIKPSINADGSIEITAQDYLGGTYTTFNKGTGGTLTSGNLISAFLETANILAAAEKAITPVENQPNNLQIDFNLEQGSATVSANLPFTSLGAASGDVTIHAIDYL